MSIGHAFVCFALVEHSLSKTSRTIIIKPTTCSSKGYRRKGGRAGDHQSKSKKERERKDREKG